MILGDVTAESGGNAGSDFALYRYTDAGGFIDAPLTVKRSDGGITLTGALLLAADPGAALGAATKQYVDNNVRAPATALPLVESGAGAVGTSVKFAREDHVHPLGPGGGGVVISDTPPASPTAGMLWWQSNTGLFFLYYNDGNSSQWVALPGGNVNPVQRSHLAGLTLSTPGASASFTVQPGVAADSTNIAMMTLPAAITKTMGAWVVGSGNGALDTGTIAANYHDVYLIRRPDTGVVDVLLTIMGNAPTLPANYTQFRRIGSLNNGLNVNQWLKFTQTGDEFLWDAPIQDLNAQAVGTTGFFATAIAPPNCEAILYAVMVSNTAITLATIHSLVANAALIVNNPVIGNYQFCTPIANVPATATNLRVRLNASRQYRIVSNASAATCQFSIATLGYIDRRGRDA
jgi:hypothetical protein